MEAKRIAAEKAVERIEDGMVVGLGTGSTAYWAIQKIGELVQQGLNVKAVASSAGSEKLARELGIPMVAFKEIDSIDITIDGADEVDTQHNLIKGGGGALLREKMLAYHSKQFVVVVDESKMVEVLGEFPLPVEIVPFAAELTLLQLSRLNGNPNIRMAEDEVYRTDNRNWIADCHFEQIEDPATLDTMIRSIPGVVETGLFLNGMVSAVIVGYKNGRVSVLEF